MTRQEPTGSMIDTILGGLRVQVCGEGPPAVLWHSLFVDSTSWDRVRDRLAADRRLILIDGACHGRSTPTTRRFTSHDCASAATEVLDALAVEDSVDWVGNAWGGHVGLLFAAARSARCRSVITIGTPAPTPQGQGRLKASFLARRTRR